MAGKSKYFEIKEQIEQMISGGDFPIGSQLPSEPKLAEMYNASRGTIRQALGELERDAVIARRSGIGTIVLRKPKEPIIQSFAAQIRATGLTPATRVLRQDKIMANEAGGRVIEAFVHDSDQAGSTVVYTIDRLRFGDQTPLARQTIYLLAGDFRSDVLEYDFTSSVFDLYARYGRRIAWADEIIQARPATPDEIDLLKMHDLDPRQQFVYVRERISYDQENLPLEVMTALDRGDFFQGYRYRILEEGLHFGKNGR